MGLFVLKFGGTSVGTPERMRSVADRIARLAAQGHQLVVVVSAMGHTTDELIDLAHQVSKAPPHREMDMLLTAGERISMALLSMALADRQVNAISFTGSQSGIITDNSHRRARIRKILGDRIRDALARGKVAIVAGFQGVSAEKEITTLGRGGSDTTAVALAAALKADLCEIYTDVNGVYSADPRVVPQARFWPEIRHDLMVELATRGAGVLHPRSVELAKQFGVRLRVRNSLANSTLHDEGTTVVSTVRELEKGPEKGMEEFSIAGVTAAKDKLLVRVELMRATVLNAIWDRAAEAHLSILCPMFNDGKVSFFTDRDADAEWKKILTELTAQGFVRSFVIDADMVPLSVVGDRFSQDGGALSEIMETLAHHGISATMGSASTLVVTVAIAAKDADDGVRALHEAFFPTTASSEKSSTGAQALSVT